MKIRSTFYPVVSSGCSVRTDWGTKRL